MKTKQLAEEKRQRERNKRAGRLEKPGIRRTGETVNTSSSVMSLIISLSVIGGVLPQKQRCVATSH